MKKELKELFTTTDRAKDRGAFSRAEFVMKEAARQREKLVRDLFRQWADIGGYRAQLTGWKIEGEGEKAELHLSYIYWKARSYGQSRGTTVLPAYYLNLSGHARATAFVEMHEKASATAEQDWARDRNTRLETLRRELERVEAEVFKHPGLDRIRKEEIEEAVQAQVHDLAKLFTHRRFPQGGRRPSNGALLAAAMRNRKAATPEVVIRHRPVIVRILVRVGYELAGRHFEAIGVSDRDSYLARAAELKRELRETRAAMPAIKAEIRARRAAGDSAFTEEAALEELRCRHIRAHDERVLMKAWAGMRMSDMRKAEDRAKDQAAA